MIRYIKNFFYLMLFLFGVIFYISNNYKSEKKVQSENLKLTTSVEKDIPNIIENINYSSFDKEGNRYLIVAKSGEVNQKNFDKIKMQSVYAKITFINQEFIEIKSKYANYNKETSETLFYGEVFSSYLDHQISSNQLELLFKEKLVKIEENVIYSSNNGTIVADKVLLNLKNKKAQILMNDSEEKVKISYLN